MHHGVRIQDAALVAAAVLSDRYLTGRFLPDKAIDLVDEAASQAAHRDRLDADRDRRRRAAHPPARDRAGRPGQGDRRRVARSASRPSTTSWPTSPSRRDAHGGALADREGGHRRASSDAQGGARGPARRARARGRPRARRPRSATAASPSWSAQVDEATAAPRRAPGRAADAEGGGRRGGRRRGRGQVDRRARLPPHGGRDAEADPPGGRPARAGGRPGRGGRPRWPTPSAAAGPACPTRTGPIGSFLFLGPTGRRQDRAGPRPRRVPLRRRAGHGPHRHVASTWRSTR